MSEEPDYSTLPLESRLVHKVWKARLEAYQELTNIFQKSPNEESDVFTPYLSQPDIFKKIVTDSNVVAQESGIVALNAFLEFGGSQVAIKLRHHLVPGLCEKGLSSSRAGTKQKTTDALLWFIDLDTADPVIELMIPSLSAKLPKLVAGTIKALAEIYAQFGAQTVSPKLVLPSLRTLFSHADRNVRSEAQVLTVELYKWLGPALEQILFSDLKPVQQKDLTKLFEKVQGEKPVQQRFLKSQRDSMLESNNNVTDDVELDGDAVMGNNEDATGPIDPYDLMEPVQVLSKLPTDLAARSASTKWKERVEVLTEAHKELQVIKLADDDYIDLVRILAKSVKDVNIQVVSLAANCIECLAKGLKRKFHKYYSIVLNPLLEKLKEKKPSVLDALNGALDSIFHSTSLSDVLEEVLEALKHKTPQIRLSSCRYLIRCLKQTREPPTRPEIESIITTCIKLVSDTLPDVRSAGFEAVGTLMKITGERELNTYLENIDDLKKKKILEFFESAEVMAKLSANKPKSQPVSAQSASRSIKPSGSGNSSLRKPTGTALTKPTGPGTGTLKKKAPNLSSTIPSKRGPSSPLKQSTGSRTGGTGARGLTGRSLQIPHTSQQTNGSTNGLFKEATVLNAEEKQELIKLRKEKEQWLEEKAKFKQQMNDSMVETSNLMKDIGSLQNKIEKLNEMRTNDIMTIKTKDTQIQRYQSDVDISRLKISQLESEIELLKKTKSLNTSIPSFSRSPFTDSHPVMNSPLQESNRLSTNTLQQQSPQLQQSLPMENLDKRVQTLSIDPESGKENPTRQSMQFDTSDDSWRRAAEVTSQLKARIEKMKAKSRNGMYRGV